MVRLQLLQNHVLSKNTIDKLDDYFPLSVSRRAGAAVGVAVRAVAA